MLPFDDAVRARRSIRAFLPEPLPDREMREMFELAGRAPSNCNTQPWRADVVSGERLREVKTKMTELFSTGTVTADYPYSGQYDGVWKERQYAAARALYNAVGIEREDRLGRHAQFMRNFLCFDAPHVAFVFLPGEFGIREAADLGMFAQTFMLALAARGYGSCPQTALSFEAEYVREALSVGDEWKLMFGISFGRPDPAGDANRCVTDRAKLSDYVEFHD